MPLLASNVDLNKPSQELVWFINQGHPSSYSTGSDSFDFSLYGNSLLFNSKLLENHSSFENTTDIGSINKKFIKFESSFLEQFDKLNTYYDNISCESANSLMKTSLSFLLELQPDTLKMELTTDRSIFYSFKKDSYSLYIQHFLDFDSEADDDEVTLTIFKGDNKQPSFAGSLDSMMLEIQRILSISFPINLKLELNELSI